MTSDISFKVQGTDYPVDEMYPPGMGAKANGVDGRSYSSMSNFSHPSSSMGAFYAGASGNFEEPISPQQLIVSMDKQEQCELEELIAALEEENKGLLKQYEEVKQESYEINSSIMNRQSSTHGAMGLPNSYSTASNQNPQFGHGGLLTPNDRGDSQSLSSNAAIHETQQLYADKYKLENRMRLLEDQNKQLEAQLERLKKLLAHPVVPSTHPQPPTLSSNHRSRSNTGKSSLNQSLNQTGTAATEPAFHSYLDSTCTPSSSFQSLNSDRNSLSINQNSAIRFNTVPPAPQQGQHHVSSVTSKGHHQHPHNSMNNTSSRMLNISSRGNFPAANDESQTSQQNQLLSAMMLQSNSRTPTQSPF